MSVLLLYTTRESEQFSTNYERLARSRGVWITDVVPLNNTSESSVWMTEIDTAKWHRDDNVVSNHGFLDFCFDGASLQRHNHSNNIQHCNLTQRAVSLLLLFLLHDAMLAWYMLLSYVCLSICPLQANTVSKSLDRLSWVLAWRLPSTCPISCYKEFHVSPK